MLYQGRWAPGSTWCRVDVLRCTAPGRKGSSSLSHVGAYEASGVWLDIGSLWDPAILESQQWYPRRWERRSVALQKIYN